MTQLLLRNLALLDPVAGILETGREVLVDGRTIAAVELGVVALVLTATWQWQARRKDFL